MAWEQLWISRPHLAYAVLGGFTIVFSLVSLFVKEKLYIGEASAATLVGLIFGPHAADLVNPMSWGNTDYITLEITRVVLVIQIFSVAAELPAKFMYYHGLGLSLLLFWAMTFGWIVSSVFIWKLVPGLRWVESLVISACITATDPVLAAAIIGKSKFASKIPARIRDLLSAESACNDGLAVPFTYLAIYLIRYEGHPREIVKNLFCLAILYQCVFGVFLGITIGYLGRKLFNLAQTYDLMDRESLLVFYIVVALFGSGTGSILGVDDLLVSFAAGSAFSWDGLYLERAEEANVSAVVDYLLNISYFVYFGSIVPWDMFNAVDIGLSAWKLVLLALILLAVRRIPIICALKPFVRDIHTWREALFCGHFGPIGVSAVFMTILVRAELAHGDPIPSEELLESNEENYMVVTVIWPVVSFMILTSIIVHGSSIAIYKLYRQVSNLGVSRSLTSLSPSTASAQKSAENGEGDEIEMIELGPGKSVGEQFSDRKSARRVSIAV
ncbi:Cation/H+ exchanger [Lipomyces oligophaga]|uniref:Cation/H+ exchanger n=1 Tax=Lipomyces oligophaga TaxID=45792 RepID=UPI0034CF8855